MHLDDLSTLSAGYVYLEGPRWFDDRLWVSEIYTGRVLAITPDGAVTTVAEVPTFPSGLGHLPDGRLLISSMADRRVLRREHDGTLVEHADLSGSGAGFINDMVVDDRGRAYIGEVGYDFGPDAEHRPGAVYLVLPDGTTSVVATGLELPNGLAVTPDGARLLVAETYGDRISAFDIGQDGTLGPRQDWALLGPGPTGRTPNELVASSACTPDGICVDADGALWVADANHHRALHVAEGGTVLETVDLGDLNCYATALGGPAGDTLFLCIGRSFHYDWVIANPVVTVRTAKVRVGARP